MFQRLKLWFEDVTLWLGSNKLKLNPGNASQSNSMAPKIHDIVPSVHKSTRHFGLILPMMSPNFGTICLMMSDLYGALYDADPAMDRVCLFSNNRFWMSRLTVCLLHRRRKWGGHRAPQLLAQKLDNNFNFYGKMLQLA